MEIFLLAFQQNAMENNSKFTWFTQIYPLRVSYIVCKLVVFLLWLAKLSPIWQSQKVALASKLILCHHTANYASITLHLSPVGQMAEKSS